MVRPSNSPLNVDVPPPLQSMLGRSLCRPRLPWQLHWHLNTTAAHCKAVIMLHCAVSRHDSGTCTCTPLYAVEMADLRHSVEQMLNVCMCR